MDPKQPTTSTVTDSKGKTFYKTSYESATKNNNLPAFVVSFIGPNQADLDADYQATLKSNSIT